MKEYSVSVKELCYYIFFVLMIAAKGMGLDSGDRLYYLLSAPALLFVAAKLCLTKYTAKELAAMALLCLLAFLSYRNSGRPGIVLSVLAVIGMKDMDIHRLFRVGLAIFGVSFLLTVSLAAGGVTENPLAVHQKGAIGEIIRWGMGYSTGNVFHSSYLILVVLLCYNMGKKYGLKSMLCLFAGNLLVFLFSLSYTGVAVTSFYLLLNLYAVKRETLSRAERILCQLPLPLCVLFSFGTPFLTGYPIGRKLNELLQARPGFSLYYLTSQPITLFGARMKDVPNFWIIMDNGYVYFLMTFGVIAFLLFFGAYGLIIKKYAKESAGRELAMIFSFLLYGIMEQFISNAFMNVSILFMGGLLFPARQETDGGLLERRRWEEAAGNSLREVFRKKQIGPPDVCLRLAEKRLPVWNEKGDARIAGIRRALKRKTGAILGFGCAMGILLTVLYAALDEKPAYVSVPLKALPYVDAQSVLVHTQRPCADKEELKELMGRYETVVREEAAAQTEKRVSGLLEFSLPQADDENGDYRTFRIRLFQGIYGMEQEDCRDVLEGLLRDTGEGQEALGLYADEIYTEKVGKDFGTDRIEHIHDSAQYLVDKSGSLVWWETVRAGVIRFLAGTALGLVTAAVIVGGRKYRPAAK